MVSYVLLTLPGLPGLKVPFGKVSLLLLTEEVEEGFSVFETHSGGLLVHTSASAEDRLIGMNK